MDRKKLAKRLIYLIFFILIVNFLANKFYWYYAVWYFDMIMHSIGGFRVGLASTWFFDKSESFKSFPESKILILKLISKALLFVMLVAIGWEVFEFLVNDVIAQNPFDFIDTISDVFFGLFGGLCAILYICKKLLK